MLIRRSLIRGLLLPPLACWVLLAAGCGSDSKVCWLAGGSYEIYYTLKSTDCAGDTIQPQWTDQREVAADTLVCGDRQDTQEKTITGGCNETCTERQKVAAQSFSGDVSCLLACGSVACSYQAEITAKKTK